MVAGNFPPKGDVEEVTIPLELGGKVNDDVGDVSHFVRRFGYPANRTPRGGAVVIPSEPAGVYTFVFTRYAGMKPYLYTQPVTVVAGEDVTLEVQLPDQLVPLRSPLGDDL